MIKGIVFDMDGLMFDTERLSVEAWVRAGAQAGYAVSEALVVETVGQDIRRTKQIFKECLGEEFDFDGLRSIKLGYMSDFIESHGVPVKPGLFELLEYLKNNRYKIAVATSTAAVRAAYYFEKTSLSGFFDGVVCGDSIQNGKPAPDIYLGACKLLGLSPAACFALEDSPAGILSAHRAGMKPVLIPDLAEPDEEIRRISFAQLDSLADVIPLLERCAHGNCV